MRTETTTRAGTESEDQRRRRWWRRPAFLVPAAMVVVAGLIGAAAAFQPWKLWVDTTLDEAEPVAVAPAPGPGQPSPAAPMVLARGSFVGQEHPTTGSVRILRLADGQRVLRLEGFDTSNGPDLKVWLTDAAVRTGPDGWFVFDDGKYVDLGELKGNVGNQNYQIPAGVDLGDYSSVSIWCDRFNVSFGAAELN